MGGFNLHLALKRIPAWTLMLLLATGLLAQTSDEAAIVKDFQQRVNDYVSVKNKQGLPTRQTNAPDKLAEQKQQAVEKIQAARPAAHQGDIFTPAIAAYFKKQIAVTMRGAEGKKIRTSLRHAEPLPNVHLEANTKYPKNLPLQSTPPTLLRNLPTLPQGMQYR